MFTSHETKEDFVYFFNALTELALIARVSLNPKFIVQDASRACYNAVAKVYPTVTVLMCWFHLKYNVKKHKSLIPDSLYDSVIKDINSLHYSTSEFNSNNTKKRISKRWENLGIIEFKNYFFKQWLDSVFCNWAIYLTPAGYSMSNCPIESYNNIIKKFITDRFKYNMLPALEIFEDNLRVMSHKSFLEFKKITRTVKLNAQDLIKDRSKFLNEKSDCCFEYKNKNNIVYEILISSECKCPECTYCSCPYFLDRAICKHITMVCIKNKITMPGLEFTEKFSVRRARRTGEKSKFYFRDQLLTLKSFKKF